MRTAVALLGLVLMCSCTPSDEGTRSANESPETSQPIGVEPTSFEYLDAIVVGLTEVDAMIQAQQSLSSEAKIVDHMTANQRTVRAVRSASSALRVFPAASDSIRLRATRGILLAYGLMDTALTRQMSALELLDRATTEGDLVGHSRRLSDMRLAFEDASKLLAMSAGMALFSAITSDSIGSALKMPPEERRSLVAKIEERFGDRASLGNEGVAGVEGAAAILHSALSKDWPEAKAQ